MELTREMRREALLPYREEWRGEGFNGDHWGSSFLHQIAIANVMDAANELTPPAWEYRPALIGTADYDVIADWHAYGEPCPLTSDENFGTEAEPEYDCQCSEERYYVPFLDAGETGIEMLRYAGNVLDRYASWLKRAGKDY